MGTVWRWIAGLGFVAVVVLAVGLIGPAVPNEIVLLTGPEGTSFHDDGVRYREILGRHGVEVRLEQTGGSAENLARLVEAETPTAGFAWGRVETVSGTGDQPPGVRSLGTMYLQPLWVFARTALNIERFRELRGYRLEAGSEGSDSRLLAAFLLREEGLGDSLIVDRDRALTIDQVQEAVSQDAIAGLVG